MENIWFLRRERLQSWTATAVMASQRKATTAQAVELKCKRRREWRSWALAFLVGLLIMHGEVKYDTEWRKYITFHETGFNYSHKKSTM